MDHHYRTALAGLEAMPIGPHRERLAAALAIPDGGGDVARAIALARATSAAVDEIRTAPPALRRPLLELFATTGAVALRGQLGPVTIWPGFRDPRAAALVAAIRDPPRGLTPLTRAMLASAASALDLQCRPAWLRHARA